MVIQIKLSLSNLITYEFILSLSIIYIGLLQQNGAVTLDTKLEQKYKFCYEKHY